MKINKSELRSLVEEVMAEAKPPRFVPKPGLGSTAVGARPSQSRKPTRDPAKGQIKGRGPSGPTRESTAEKAWRDFLKVLRQNKMSFSKGKINDAKSGKLLVAVDKIR